MKLLGVDYDNLTVPEALNAIVGLAAARNKANVFFLNADCLYKAQSDKEYRSVLDAADLVLPDGIGIRLATKVFGGTMRDNCNGTDLSPQVLQEAARRGLKVFLLGGKEGVAQKAAGNLQGRFPGIKIVGARSGYFSDDQDVIKQINDSGADVLFVAMGVPLQEKWIHKNRQALHAKVCLGVGALLDYLSGSVPRAPQWMRRLYLEWFWRIWVDPQRMFRRYIIDGSCFVVYALYRRLKGG